MAVTGPALLGFASAVALFGLAILLLRLRPLGGPALMLALFATVWGVQQAELRLAMFAGQGDLGVFLLQISQAATVPLYLFLAHFAAIFPAPLRFTRSPLWLPALALPGFLLVALAWSDIKVALDVGADFGQPVFGWGTVFLPFLAFLCAEIAALARFALGYLRSESPLSRAQFRWCLLGLLPYLSYQQGNLMATAPFLAPALGPTGTPLFTAVMALGFVCVVAVAVALVLLAPATERLLWIVLAFVPAWLGWVIAPSEVFGLFRLVLVGALAYAVAKYQMFDLDLRLHRNVRPLGVALSVLAVVGIATAGVAFQTTGFGSNGDLFGQGWELLGGAALVGILVGTFMGLAVSREIERRFPYLRSTDEYLLRRRMEVYGAGVQRGLSREQLTHLARQLRLRPWERRVLDQPTNGHASPLAPGALLAKRYRISRFLGPGMYGRVFLAQDERVGEPVVLKEYAGFGGTAASEAFAREAKTLGALDHHNVLAVRDVFRAGDDMYIALEHAPDGSLEERLAKGALPEPEALDLAQQLLSGLAAAHKKGIVHRDVKPSNVLFKGKVLKLADFGVAFDPVFDGAMRAAAAQPGTLLWMAPEQALGKGADNASDVYAAGAVLYRMLAGRHYLDLEGKSEQAVRRAIAERPPRLPLPGVSGQLNAVLARALAKEPGERYPDAAAMLRDLKAPWRPALAPRGRPAAGRAYGTP